MAAADGETLQEIQQVLHIPPKLRSDAVHQSYGPIISKYFEASSDVDLNIANRLFLLKSTDIRPEYSALVATCYKALVELLDILTNQRVIFSWWVVALLECGLNKSIGSWDHQFDKEQTQESDFHCLNGESMKVQMMYRKSEFYLADLAELDCTGIKLPFKQSSYQSEWALLILLPHEKAGLPKLLSRLQAPGQLGSRFHMENAYLYLPKLKLTDETMIDLKPILYECGMKKLFSGGYLSRLSQSRLTVTHAYHKAVLESEWALLILLPHEKAGLPKLLSRLQAPGQLGSRFHMENAYLYLPKLKLTDETMIDLKPILYECGMKKLFSGGYLSRLSQSRLTVTHAYHKAVLELDKEGVTAAASNLFT
ncbi:hypothetical protein CRM22_000410, partial [Opisthorchis felineus]